MRVCHLSLSVVPALRFDVGEAEVRQAVVAAAVHRSVQTLEGCRKKETRLAVVFTLDGWRHPLVVALLLIAVSRCRALYALTFHP